MSEFHVEVVQIKNVTPHPNADTLDQCIIHDGYPVLFKRGEFKEGDLAIYVPVDSIVPDRPEWAWLGGHRRIKAKRLRGVFSMGLLAKYELAPEPLGTEVTEALGITKYEEPEPGGPNQAVQLPMPPLRHQPSHYDIDAWRKYGASMFHPFNHVLIQEKIHGQNFRAVFTHGKLHVGSRSRWVEGDNTWIRTAAKYRLEEKLAAYAGFVFFGEVYGNNSDMDYNAKASHELRIFDIWDSRVGEWLPLTKVFSLCSYLELPVPPTLAEGGFRDLDQVVKMLAEGTTTINGAKHVREGVVIRSATGDRKILKLHGEGYLTR